MSSTSLTETLLVPLIVTGVTTLYNYSLGMPQDYLIKDSAISFGSALADEVTFNMMIDPYILSDSVTGSAVIDTLAKPFGYAIVAHVARMLIQKEYTKNIGYSMFENSIIYMSSDYLSIPLQKVF